MASCDNLLIVSGQVIDFAKRYMYVVFSEQDLMELWVFQFTVVYLLNADQWDTGVASRLQQTTNAKIFVLPKIKEILFDFGFFWLLSSFTVQHLKERKNKKISHFFL